MDPIYLDPETGITCFATRSTSDRGDGKGYRVVTDSRLKMLPDAPKGATFSPEQKARYRAYKELRRGAADYVSPEGDLSTYLDDPDAPERVRRDALTDTCDVVVIGAGFAGLVLWHKLWKAGFRDVRFCEKGGDVGGTWYWNRYPGVACDVEAYSYLPLLEEMEYIPSMKFASGSEIYHYCQKMAEKFGFYERCLFDTTVERTEWDEQDGRWTVHTDRGDAMRARFVVLANGILTSPKLARVEGMTSFEGESFHTSRWNHHVELGGKRVGVIGTGATAVQLIPQLAKVVDELYVFQRTPSTVDVRDQRRTTPEEIDQWAHEEGWARARRARFARISAGRSAMKANDDYLAGRVPDFKPRKKHAHEISTAELVEKQLESNFRIMEQIRARIDVMVDDPAVAEILKPYYPYGCKRPTFHDEYLPTFNLPHVHLVDVAPTGVREITPKGIRHDHVDYDLDVIIYATGFQWMATSTFNMVKGRDGETLTEKWRNHGTRTFLGIHSRGFPNLFVVTGPQGGGGSFNFTDGIESHTDYVTWMLTTMRANGWDTVDVTLEAEEEYASHCREMDLLTAPLRDCFSYYNGEGNAEPGSLGYQGGPRWHQRREQAQSTLEPYAFGSSDGASLERTPSGVAT